ncbi:MAG TPA: hypothetical protein VFK86_07220 [Bauldia sp.]|nr:hypothetical protein [Bauldia sp.]
MRTGLIVSAAVHLVLIGWGLITLAVAPLDASHIETLPVEFVEVAEVTDLDLGKESGEEAETPSPNDPADTVAEEPPPVPDTPGVDEPTPPPPPPPPSEAASAADAADAEAETPPALSEPEPLPEDAAEEPPPEPTPPQVASAPPSPRLRPDRPAPETLPAPESPEASDAFTEQIAALIDRTNTGTAQLASEAPATLGVATGSPDAKMTQSEIDALRSQIERCWVIPTGWTHPREVSVTIRFGLNIDGTVAGKPEVVEFPASQYGQVSADNAIRAVLQCGPYALPAEKYDQWAVVQLRFTPPG